MIAHLLTPRDLTFEVLGEGKRGAAPLWYFSQDNTRWSFAPPPNHRKKESRVAKDKSTVTEAEETDAKAEEETEEKSSKKKDKETRKS